MKKSIFHFWPFWFLVRIALGTVFVYSGLGKILSPLTETRALFYEYALLPAILVPWIALLFPWVEFFTGAFLFLGYRTRLAAGAVMGFTFGFILLLGSEFLLKGHFPQDCGCFAGSWKLPTSSIFLMDLMNFLLTFQLVRLDEHRLSLDRWMDLKWQWINPREFIGALLVVVLTVFAIGMKVYGARGLPDLPSKSSQEIISKKSDAVSTAVEYQPFGQSAVPVSASAQERKQIPLKSMGESDAPIEILEYTDFQCPACRGSKPLIADLMARHPGEVRVIFKHYPLEGHRWARPAHRAAECAHAQGHFWDYHHLLYDNQQVWAGEKNAEVFIKFAADLSLDVSKFQGCMNSSEPDIGLEADIAEGKRMGIRATPTFFINGERLVGGRELQLRGEEMIRKVLKKSVSR